MRFNVTGFSVYSADETPNFNSHYSWRGGGAGKVIAKRSTFKVDREIIKTLIKAGDIFKSSIKIKNTEGYAQNFKLEVITLEDFIIIPESEFSLQPQEEKEVVLIFSSPRNIAENTYTGILKISASSEKEIPIVLGINSRIALFDITMNIPAAYKDLKPGDDILFQISLFNLGEIGKVDVDIEYSIKDLYGNTILENREIVAVETQASFSRSLKLPEDMADGQYVAIVNVKYGSSVGTTSDIFYINRKTVLNKLYLIALILAILTIAMSTILIILHFNRKVKEISRIHTRELDKIKEKISRGQIKTEEAARIGEKLRLKLSLLNRAYKKGYINKDSYKRGREKIKGVYRSLRKKYL